MSRELAIAVQADVPVILWGAPGVGKSSFMRAFGEALDFPVETVIASIREPADFAGLPIAVQHQWVVWAQALAENKEVPEWLRSVAHQALVYGGSLQESGVEFAPPAWAVRLARQKRGLLFFDECSTAPPAVQAALLRPVLERQVGDLALPPEVRIVAAANPVDMAAGGWDLAPPLANRFCHLEWGVDASSWVDGMLRGWPLPTIPRLPENWKLGIPAARALFAGYIRHRPEKLLIPPKSEEAAGRAWPSPRSWEMSAFLMAANQAGGGNEDTLLRLIAGCVGEGEGVEFWKWRRDQDLPDPEELIRNPGKFVLPKRSDLVFTVLGSVISAVVTNLTDVRWLAAWEILGIAADQGAADVAAAAGRSLVEARRPDLTLPLACRKLLQLMKDAGALAER